jgi:cytochrome c553
MSDRHNAEPWERTTLMISEERALRPRARIAASERAVGPCAIVVSAYASPRDRKPASVQVIAARCSRCHGSTGQPGRAAPPSPRGRGTNETRFGGALQQNLLKIKDGAISGAGTKELLRWYRKAVRHLPTPLGRGSDTL